MGDECDFKILSDVFKSFVCFKNLILSVFILKTEWLFGTISVMRLENKKTKLSENGTNNQF